MKIQDHKSTTDNGKAKTRPGIKTSPQVKHPILQLQQLVGNKTVTNMIQRNQASWIRLDADLENHSLGITQLRYPSSGEQG